MTTSFTTAQDTDFWSHSFLLTNCSGSQYQQYWPSLGNISPWNVPTEKNVYRLPSSGHYSHLSDTGNTKPNYYQMYLVCAFRGVHLFPIFTGHFHSLVCGSLLIKKKNSNSNNNKKQQLGTSRKKIKIGEACFIYIRHCKFKCLLGRAGPVNEQSWPA